MPTRIDYIEGQKIGEFTFIKRVSTRRAIFKCICGNEIECNISNVKGGTTISCGCIRNMKHGRTAKNITDSTIAVYYKMKQRCNNPNNSAYKYYGGKGVKVCDGWMQSFQNFLADMGERPVGKTLERKNSDGNYEPNNCVWATRKEQVRNTSRNSLFTYKGQTKCVGEWAEEYNMCPGVLNGRLKHGWDIQEALTKPVIKNKTHK